MIIFKRGKHAKAEEPNTVDLSADSIQSIAEAVEPRLAKSNELIAGDNPGLGYEPGEVAFPEGFNAQWFVDDKLQEVGVNPFEVELDLVLGEVRSLLLEKNASYGDSALNPVRIMSDADAAEQIRIRMDDKLSRLYRGFAFEDTATGNPEDTLKDLVGYYFLLKIAEARNAQS